MGRISWQTPTPLVENNTEDVVILELQERERDTLKMTSNTDIRIIWTGENMSEGQEFSVPLGQVLTADEALVSEYKWVGNEESKKYYATDSYRGRGIAPEVRRLFYTEKEAEAEGFTKGG